MTKLGIIMDPIESIKTVKDTTFALMLAAQRRKWQLFYIPHDRLFLRNEIVSASMNAITVKDQTGDHYQLGERVSQALNQLDAVLFRKDPPFNMDYIYLTYLLERATTQGALVINNPQSIRDANEKLFATQFPQCCPETLVSAKATVIKLFAEKHDRIVIKPLDGMGGQSIFMTGQTDPNFNVIIETVTQQQTRLVMVQRFIPEINQGDKRLLMINGEPLAYVLARIPSADDFRGNLAAGATYEGRALSERDHWIAQQLGPVLREKGLVFVGLDIIGDYLTEINVTSPTGARELERLYDIDICGKLLDCIDRIKAEGRR